MLRFLPEAALALAVAQGAYAQSLTGGEAERSSLRGLRGIEVRVTGLSLDLELRSMISNATIREQIVRELQLQGVPVVPQASDDVVAYEAQLLVRLRVVEARTGLYAYGADLELLQPASLARPRGVLFQAITWSRRDVGVAADITAIRGKVLQQLAEFVSDFIAANPPARRREGPGR